MILSDYTAKVTETILEIAGPNFIFPESFEADVAIYFARFVLPERAATKILADME